MTLTKLLSAQQVADFLGIHVKTLCKQLRENRISLTFIRTGNRIAFRPSDVETYVATHEVRRDGRGMAQPRKRKKAPASPGAGIRLMSDHEAQEFFEGVTAREDEYTGRPTLRVRDIN